MALTDQLVAYYKLDESSGNIADAVNANTLTNNGTVTFAPVVINNGAIFTSPNTTQYFEGTNAAVEVTADVSLQAWIYVSSIDVPDGANCLISKGAYVNAASIRYLLQVFGTLPNLTIEFGQSDGTTYRTLDKAATIAQNTLYHLIVTYKLSTGVATYYLNASSLGTTGSGGTAWSGGTGSLAIGRRSGASAYQNGKMDEIGIWSRELTSGEVTQLYNGGAGLAYPFSSGTTLPFRALLGVGL